MELVFKKVANISLKGEEIINVIKGRPMLCNVNTLLSS